MRISKETIKRHKVRADFCLPVMLLLYADLHRADALDKAILPYLGAHRIQLDILSHIAQGIRCGICRILMVRRARIGAWIRALLLFQPSQIVNLALDAVDNNRRLSTLFKLANLLVS